MFLANGTSPNREDNVANPLIHLAILFGNEDLVKHLLTFEEIDVNAKDANGETVLFRAVRMDHLAIVTILIKAKCDLDLANNNGHTPIHESLGNPRILQLLLENGADPDVVDHNGATVLHKAVVIDYVEAVHMLLYFNADPNIPDTQGFTPFMTAIAYRRMSIQETLFEYVTDFNAGCTEHYTTVAFALRFNSPLLKGIIDRGGNVNYTSLFKNAFVFLVENPDPVKFELVWKHFEYQPLSFNESYIPYLYNSLQLDMFCAYLAIIVASGNVEPIFVDFSFSPIYLYYICKEENTFMERWSTFVQMIYLYLSHGYSTPMDIICTMYAFTGYSELLWICLHMDISNEGSSSIPKPSVLSILFYPSLSTERFYFYLLNWIRHKWVRVRDCCDYFRLGSTRKHEKIQITSANKALLTDIPSLKELGRNATRDYILRKFKIDTCKNYVFFVQYLPIFQVYKDILLFKKAIYM